MSLHHSAVPHPVSRRSAFAILPESNGLLIASVFFLSGCLALLLALLSAAQAAEELPDLGNTSVVSGSADELSEPEHPFAGLIDLQGSLLESPPAIGEGQWTLVMIWATDCHICKQQKPVISAFHDAHKDNDAQVFGIALDGRQGLDDVHQYLDEHVVSFPNYIGDYPSVAIGYQKLTEEALLGTPTYLLFDPEGALKGNNPGPIGIEAIEDFIARHSG